MEWVYYADSKKNQGTYRGFVIKIWGPKDDGPSRYDTRVYLPGGDRYTYYEDGQGKGHTGEIHTPSLEEAKEAGMAHVNSYLEAEAVGRKTSRNSRL